MTEEQKKPTKAAIYSKRYREKQKDIKMKLIDFAGEAGIDVMEILRELVRTANSNPIIGVLLSIVTIDMLHRAKLIGENAVVAFYIVIGAIESGSVISDIANLWPSFTRNTQVDPVRPSATTVVYGGENGKDIDLQALMEQLSKK